VVVLDDDPTGTQTVHDVPILTHWPVDALACELEAGGSCFYLLTNSRALSSEAAEALNREIGRNLVAASRRTGRALAVVSRSDSTLRGHFPGEVQALAEALREDYDGWLLVPFFIEGGRYTVGDVHYVDEEGVLIPAGETPFARDKAFGYRSSNLRAWVEEKTEGRVRAGDVVSISIDDLRLGGPKRVSAMLQGVTGGRVVVVNAAGYRDLQVLVAGLLAAEAQGKRFLYRTASSFVQVRVGLDARPLLTASDLDLPASGGALIVVGSYVPRTTAQVDRLLTLPGVDSVEIKVPALLDDDLLRREISRVIAAADGRLAAGRDVVVYTSRDLVTADDAAESLSIGNRISAGIVDVVRGITARPRYLIAKGGITSSDVATAALGVKRALVCGQILPGVPLWQLGSESRYPGMPYVVFPGNVGGPEAIGQVVLALR
jgi:uncharacterized protein YgbK (DUF1537 family)